jgi:hypothetical protein
MAWIGIEATPEPVRIDWTVVLGWTIVLALVAAYVGAVLVFGDDIAREIQRALRPAIH